MAEVKIGTLSLGLGVVVAATSLALMAAAIILLQWRSVASRATVPSD